MDWLPAIFRNTWVWLVITLGCFALCTFLPIKIKDDRLRHQVMIFVLVPVSLVIIFYVYPVGLEVARRLAIIP